MQEPNYMCDNKKNIYYMGVDPYTGYDGKACSAVVMEKIEGNNTIVVAQYQGRDSKDNYTVIENMKKYYDITDDRVIYFDGR